MYPWRSKSVYLRCGSIDVTRAVDGSSSDSPKYGICSKGDGDAIDGVTSSTAIEPFPVAEL